MRLLLPILATASLVTIFAACDDDGSSTAPPGGDGGLALPDGSGTGDGASSDAASGRDSGLDGGADAEAPLVPDWYVDPVNGADTNDGKTTATAFKTLCKVDEVVQANQVIGLRDGAYNNANQRPPGWLLNPPCSPTFNVPVRLVAINPGQALVQVSIDLAQGGEIRGVKMAFETLDSGSLQGASINATGGELLIRDLTLGEVWSPPNAKGAALVVSGSAKVTVRPGAVTNYATVPVPVGKGFSFAFVSSPGELTMEGGTIDDSAPANADSYCNPLFEGSGKITLNGMTIRHKGSVVRATGATFAVTGGTLEDRSTPFNVGCFPLVDLVSNATVTLTNTTLGGGTRVGIGTTPLSGGTLTLSGVTLSSFTTAGIDVTANGGQPLALSVRGSTIQANDVGIRVANAVTADLGTSASPGNNTITGNTTRGLESTTLGVVNAAGNTWTASQQGAGADGKYPASLQAGPASGVNYSLVSAAHTIQF